MRRREFITLLGGAAAAWPSAARAQQQAMPVIGFLHSAPLPISSHLIAAFSRGLAQTGYLVGRNIAIEYRTSDGQNDRLPELAADLIRHRVSVIATPGSAPAAVAAKAATATLPIVFGTADDPVKLGLVASLNRPGGNATGVSFLIAELVGKRLALLRELVPGAARVAVLVNPTDATRSASTARDVEAAARALGLQVQALSAGNSREIDAAFTSLGPERADALFVGPDPFFYSRRVHLAVLAAHHRVPATYAIAVSRGRRADELWNERPGDVLSVRCLCRPS